MNNWDIAIQQSELTEGIPAYLLNTAPYELDWLAIEDIRRHHSN